MLIKGGIRAHDHIEPACQVFHIEPCQNLSSLADSIFHKVQRAVTGLNFHKLQEFNVRFKILVFCFDIVLPNHEWTTHMQRNVLEKG